MKILVTGSAGHLGEALVRTLQAQDKDVKDVVGLDILASPFTTVVGSIADRDCVQRCMDGVDTVLHTATLHKPHVVTHSMQDFVHTNITGTLVLLEEAAKVGVQAFVFTSTTSVFGDALRPPQGQPAAWVTEDVQPIPKNIYGVTKSAAEDLCQLFSKKHELACVVLRTSRFFPEEDDNASMRLAYEDSNIKTNELLFRRVDLEDVVQAHLRAIDKAPIIGFDRFIISATTPFSSEDLQELRDNAPLGVERRVPDAALAYRQLGWKMFPSIDRVYVNSKAREVLDWQPRYDFKHVIACLSAGTDPRSPLSREVGSKGYHSEVFKDGPYPVE